VDGPLQAGRGVVELRAMAKTRIMLVEDEQDIATLVARRLRREGYEVTTADDGAEGLKCIQRDRPDLLLLDLMLPGIDGLEITRQLKGSPATAGIPIIMLTARSEEEDIVVGLGLGADDYITKPFSASVLVARIDAVMRRANSATDDEATDLRAGPVVIDSARYVATVDDEPIELTLTEFRLLEAIIKARGRVLTRDQLIDHAIGPDVIVTDRTIDVHITALRRKLGQARWLVETVRGIGYRLAEQADEA
jgi:DNA-binding response OmpR family regulator